MQLKVTSFGLGDKQLGIIKNIFDKYLNVKKVLIFGSRSQGTSKIFSDIDLCIIESKIDFRTLLQIREDFFESDLIYKVDLHNFQDLSNQKFKDRILRDGKTIFERKS